MKTITPWQTGLALTALGAVVLMAGCADAADKSPSLMEPELTPLFTMSTLTSKSAQTLNSWQSGNATNECAQVGDFQYACKIDDWGEGDVSMDGTYHCPLGSGDIGDNTLTIRNDDGTYFDWTATNPVGAVIVKGGPGANVFHYDPQAYFDAGLYAPTNPNNHKPYGISHVTFCWNPANGCEWKGETAWSAGSRYVTRGNWATFTPYVPGSTVTLYAGQTKDAGTVHFSAVDDGKVTITITLNDGWRFEDVDHNVKIQDYLNAPSGNPAPGLFAHKDTAAGSPFSIEVPANNFYGVHVDVEWEKCD